MRKKMIICLLTFGVLAGMLTGCTKSAEEETKLDPERIQEITQLCTQTVVLNMVTKDVNEKDKGLLNILDQDRNVWIQYQSEVPVSVELPKDFLEEKGNHIKVKEPVVVVGEADIVDGTFTKDSFYISDESWYSSNKITAKEQQELMAAAQSEAKERVEKNQSLIEMAVNSMKKNVEQYIYTFGELTGTEYEIEWIK